MATKSKSKSSKTAGGRATKSLPVRKDQAGKVKGGQAGLGQVRGGPVLGQEDLA